MRLGKMLSVGEVVEQAPAAEPAAATPAPAAAAAPEDRGQVPAGASAGR